MQRAQTFTLAAIILIIFVLWGFHYAGFDLWWDEINSLTEYSLVSFHDTVSTYPDPNNHILFNLLDNLLTRIYRLRDIYQLADQAAALRWSQWFIALGGLIYLFLTGRKFFGPPAGMMAAAFQVSCLPFLNFAMQLRGYNLSIFFVTGILYHSGSCLERRSAGHALAAALFSFCLLYTIPSNIYFLAGLAGIVLVALLVHLPRRPAEEHPPAPFLRRLWRRPESMLLLAFGVGTLITYLAYLPVIENVLGNRFLAKHPAHRFFILSERLPQVAGHMLSYRYALLLIVLPGFFRAFRDASRRLQGSSKAAALLGLFFLPFGFSFLRNDAAFERTFVNLTPVFALILAAGCGWMIQGRKRTVWIRWSIPLICAIALATLGFAYAHLQQRLQDNLQKGFHEQSILANQYQAAGYHPAETAETLAEMVRMEPGPVILVGALDRVAWSFYLDKVDIPSLALVRIEALPPQDRNGASTHAGIFQVSQGMGRETVFVQQDLLISKEPEDLILTPLIQFVGSREFTGPIYLVTDSPVLVSSLLETHFPGFEGKRLGRSMDAGSLFVLRPGRS